MPKCTINDLCNLIKDLIYRPTNLDLSIYIHILILKRQDIGIRNIYKCVYVSDKPFLRISSGNVKHHQAFGFILSSPNRSGTKQRGSNSPVVIIL